VKACSEIERTLKKGGLFLLIVDIHSRPTFTEPQSINWEMLKKQFSGSHILEERKLEEVHRHRIYKNLRSNVALKNISASRYVLTVKLQKDK
jgi:hypothetical protein